MSGFDRVPPPRPPWVTVPAIAFQAAGIFLLPFVVGFAGTMFFETSEVVETGSGLMTFVAVLLLPIAFAQVVGVLAKSSRDVRYWRLRRSFGAARFLDVVATHLSVVTLRGWTLLAIALLFTFLALAFKIGELGLLGVLGLFLFYLVTGWTVFVSAFLVAAFDRGTVRRGGAILRSVHPAVVQQGDPVEESFLFRRIPVPWGYLLVVEDANPWRLRTESRYVVGGAGRRGETEARGGLRATPRGHYFLGPAKLWYQDLLGITRVSVGAQATAELKVLPRIRPVEVVDPPKTQRQTPDVVTRPNRFATEDWFRFREYASGDDTRRIHWRLSLRSGHLQVRQPETREITTEDVVLALDTFLPKGRLLDASHGADEIVDALVEAWLGIAKALVDKGDRVTLVAAVQGHDRDEIAVETVRCVRGEAARWQDLGARARWQHEHDVPDLLAKCGEKTHGVVVTARFTAAPPGVLPGQTVTWLFLDPADALGPPDPHWLGQIAGGTSPLRVISWLFRLPHPAGAEENALPRRIVAAWRIVTLHRARAALRAAARARAGATLKELEARGDGVYRIERKPAAIRLVGLRAATAKTVVRRTA